MAEYASIIEGSQTGEIPVVAIVGRPNVGKSSLFNMLARRRIAIVHQTSGITRDRVATVIEHKGRAFELWDTGGMASGGEDALEEEINAQIDLAISRADLTLFVVDAREGFNESDRDIANRLRKIGGRILLVANKADSPKQEMLLPELHQLGLGEPIPTCAIQREGREDLLDRIIKSVPRASAPKPSDDRITLAIVGRQNVGKSTLTNNLLGQERMIVSEVAGTTRDSVDAPFRWKGRDYLLIDTAGMKKRSKSRGDLEFYSAHRAERSIRRADVVVFMLDATVEIGRIDKKIASYIEEQAKPCVILVNKWDLTGEVEPEQFTEYLTSRLPLLIYAPVMYASALEGVDADTLLETVDSLREQSRIRVGTGELNRAVEEAVKRNPPPPRMGKAARVLFATQVRTEPPTFVIFVNYKERFTDRYYRFLANFLRERFGFSEIPLRIYLRSRRRDEDDSEK